MTGAEFKKKAWEKISSTNGKIAIVIAFFVGYQELMPILKDVLGFTADNKAIVEECKLYTDEAIHNKEEKANSYLDILMSDIVRIQKKMYNDSVTYAQKNRKFAVGFRSDLNGIMSYRNKFGRDCPTRINHLSGTFEFYDMRQDKWLRCFYED
jgi:hypothetical protein